MWFKQAQLFQFEEAAKFSTEELINKLEALAFKPCLPSMPSSAGWVSPIDEEEASLVRSANGYHMLCLQIEEKILPATVIKQELQNKIKQIQKRDDRKVRSHEKNSLKDAVIIHLLPRAFSKLSRVYAYIDVKNQWLVLSTTNAKMTEQFLALFKKTISEKLTSFSFPKLSETMTRWLQNQNYSNAFAVEKACMLQDPNQQKRVIRCQQQDLFAHSIQALVKDGCAVKQLALMWQDRVNFILADDFTLRSIQYLDEIVEQAKELEPETVQQQFDADFLIMTGTLSHLCRELLQGIEQPNVVPIAKQA